MGHRRPGRSLPSRGLHCHKAGAPVTQVEGESAGQVPQSAAPTAVMGVARGPLHRTSRLCWRQGSVICLQQWGMEGG